LNIGYTTLACPLFACDALGRFASAPFGKDGRLILRRSFEMEALMIREVSILFIVLNTLAGECKTSQHGAPDSSISSSIQAAFRLLCFILGFSIVLAIMILNRLVDPVQAFLQKVNGNHIIICNK
jgi:hypothetical protein